MTLGELLDEHKEHMVLGPPTFLKKRFKNIEKFQILPFSLLPQGQSDIANRMEVALKTVY